jgi:hypothetical protein
VPVGIRTDYFVWHVWHFIKWLGKPKNKAVITIGEALHFDYHYEKPLTERLLAEITTDIMQEIGMLSEKGYDSWSGKDKIAGTG